MMQYLFYVLCFCFSLKKKRVLTCNKKMYPQCSLFYTELSVFQLDFFTSLPLSLSLSDSFEMDSLWLKLHLVFNQLPEHSSPFSSQCIHTQAEYQPNPSTAVLVIFFFFNTQTTFIHPCTLCFARTQYTQIQVLLQRQVLFYFQEIFPFLSI